MLNMSSPPLDYPLNSSVTEILKLHQNSQGNSAISWESNITYPQHITHKQRGSQNAPISGWNSIWGSGSTSVKITGWPIYPWQSSHITIGSMRPQGSPLFFLLMGYNPHTDWTDCSLPIPQVMLCLNQFKEAQKWIQELMTKAQKSWVKNKDMPKFQVWDQVWLEGHHFCTNQANGKTCTLKTWPI